MGAGRLLVADLDGTLLGDDGALVDFGAWLAPRRAEHRLVYASGRLLPSVRAAIRQTPLPRPDATITGVGTEVHDADGRPWPGWLQRLGDWDAAPARRALEPVSWLWPQEAVHQTRFKASYDVPGLGADARAELERRLHDAGIAAALVYSGDLHLDILPPAAGKGRAASFLADAWSIASEDVLAFGDLGNDLELLSSGFRGTIVANALPELRLAVGADVYRSPRPYAAGVLDGIRHWTSA